MKAGYPEAAWRLLEPVLTFRPRPDRRELTWAEVGLADSPFVTRKPPLPIVPARGSH